MIDTRKTPASSQFMAGVGDAFSTIVHFFRHAAERRATRAALSRLDAHLLRDIGLSKDAAHAESLRHFFLE